MSYDLSRIKETLVNLESALATHMRYGGKIPPARLFAHRNAAGLTEREIALSEKWYCDGANMVLREMRWQVTALERQNSE